MKILESIYLSKSFHSYIPVVSTITSLATLVLKAQYFFQTQSTRNKREWIYIKEMSLGRLVTLLIPVLGNLCIYCLDKLDRKKLDSLFQANPKEPSLQIKNMNSAQLRTLWEEHIEKIDFEKIDYEEFPKFIHVVTPEEFPDFYSKLNDQQTKKLIFHLTPEFLRSTFHLLSNGICAYIPEKYLSQLKIPSDTPAEKIRSLLHLNVPRSSLIQNHLTSEQSSIEPVLRPAPSSQVQKQYSSVQIDLILKRIQALIQGDNLFIINSLSDEELNIFICHLPDACLLYLNRDRIPAIDFNGLKREQIEALLDIRYMNLSPDFFINNFLRLSNEQILSILPHLHDKCFCPKVIERISKISEKSVVIPHLSICKLIFLLPSLPEADWQRITIEQAFSYFRFYNNPEIGPKLLNLFKLEEWINYFSSKAMRVRSGRFINSDGDLFHIIPYLPRKFLDSIISQSGPDLLFDLELIFDTFKLEAQLESVRERINHLRIDCENLNRPPFESENPKLECEQILNEHLAPFCENSSIPCSNKTSLKKAFCKFALEMHPDKNKEISEADRNKFNKVLYHYSEYFKLMNWSNIRNNDTTP